jgi:hypothetical protein
LPLDTANRMWFSSPHTKEKPMNDRMFSSLLDAAQHLSEESKRKIAQLILSEAQETVQAPRKVHLLSVDPNHLISTIKAIRNAPGRVMSLREAKEIVDAARDGKGPALPGDQDMTYWTQSFREHGAGVTLGVR